VSFYAPSPDNEWHAVAESTGGRKPAQAEQDNAFTRAILSEGKVMYEARHA
jgi:hypothetical protein